MQPSWKETDKIGLTSNYFIFYKWSNKLSIVICSIKKISLHYFLLASMVLMTIQSQCHSGIRHGLRVMRGRDVCVWCGMQPETRGNFRLEGLSFFKGPRACLNFACRCDDAACAAQCVLSIK
jgi:hypothetical protein